MFTRPVPAPKSQRFSSLSNGSTGTSREGPRSSSQPRASAQAGSSRTVQQKQDAKTCDRCYTTQARTPEVTENLHLTTCHRGLLASLGPHPWTLTCDNLVQAHESNGQFSYLDGATPPHPTKSEIHCQASDSSLVLLSRYVLMDSAKSISQHPY